MKHTKGEFIIGTPKQEQTVPELWVCHVYVYTKFSNRELHAKVYGDTEEEVIANAKLTAVAPDFISICDEILILWHSKSSNMNKKEPIYLEKIRQALRDATE